MLRMLSGKVISPLSSPIPPYPILWSYAQEIGFIISILQVRKQRLREVK